MMMLAGHRLDRLTSGILVIARTLNQAKRMSRYLEEQSLRKVYVCRVLGE